MRARKTGGLLSSIVMGCALAATGLGSYWFASEHTDKRLDRWNRRHEGQILEVDAKHSRKQNRLYARLKKMRDVIKEDRDHIRSLEEKLSNAHSLKKDGRYDFSNDLFDPSELYIEQLFTATYQLKIKAVFEKVKKKSKKKKTVERHVSGIFYPGNYLITAHHVVELDEDESQSSQN